MEQPITKNYINPFTIDRDALKRPAKEKESVYNFQ